MKWDQGVAEVVQCGATVSMPVILITFSGELQIRVLPDKIKYNNDNNELDHSREPRSPLPDPPDSPETSQTALMVNQEPPLPLTPSRINKSSKKSGKIKIVLKKNYGNNGYKHS